jgi:hypothetical protein
MGVVGIGVRWSAYALGKARSKLRHYKGEGSLTGRIFLRGWASNGVGLAEWRMDGAGLRFE